MVQTVSVQLNSNHFCYASCEMSLIHREALVKDKIESYGKTGAAEGGITGAGGFLMSLADFPS